MQTQTRYEKLSAQMIRNLRDATSTDEYTQDLCADAWNDDRAARAVLAMKINEARGEGATVVIP